MRIVGLGRSRGRVVSAVSRQPDQQAATRLRSLPIPPGRVVSELAEELSSGGAGVPEWLRRVRGWLAFSSRAKRRPKLSYEIGLAVVQRLELRLLLTNPEPVAPVFDTTVVPNRAAVQLVRVWNTDGSKDTNDNPTLTPGDTHSLCSGALIESNTVLTAAHCLYDQTTQKFPDWIFVHAGRDGEFNRPYGEARAVSWEVPQGWADSNSDSWRYDLGLLSLDRNLGDSTGVFNYRAMPGTETIISDYVPTPIQAGQVALNVPFDVPFRPVVKVLHYPAEGPTQYNGWDQFVSDGRVTAVNDDSFSYDEKDLWATGGSSGAPVFINQRVNGEQWTNTILGVHVRSTDNIPGEAGTGYATRLDTFWVDYINRFISDHAGQVVNDRPALVDSDRWFDRTSVISKPAPSVGETVQVSASVRNMGTAAASNVAVRFRLSTDNVYQNTDQLLGTVTIPNIPAMSTRDAVLSFSVPAVRNGQTNTWNVVWSIDPDNTINEFDSPFNDIMLNPAHTLHASNFGFREFRIVNTAPVFAPLPSGSRSLQTFEGEQVRVAFNASDPEGQTVSYSLSTQFIGASVDSSTGVFLWTPPADFGDFTLYFTVIASDGLNKSTSEIEVKVKSSKPTIGQLTARPVSILNNASQLVTVTATGIDSGLPGKNLSRVEFYFDRNGNGALDANDDSLGWDTNGADGWSWTGAIGGLTAGSQARIFAQAVRFSDLFTHKSAAKAVVLNITAAPPVQPAAFPFSSTQSLVASNYFGGQVTRLTDGDYLTFFGRYGEPLSIRRFSSNGSAVGAAVTLPGSEAATIAPGVQVAVRPTGEVAVVWNDLTTGLMLKRYAANGTAIGSTITLGTSFPLSFLSINASGNFVVGAVDGFTRINGRLYAWDGTPLTSEFQIVDNAELLTVDLASLHMLPDGRFVANWRPWTGNGPQQWSNRGRAFDALGQAVGGEFLINSDGASIETAHMAVNSFGNIVAVYRDENDAASRFFARRFDALGVPVGNAFPLNTILLRHDGYSVSMNDAGWFGVAWDVRGADPGDASSDEGVYVQIVDHANQLQGPEFRVPVTTAGDQNGAVIAMGPDGDFGVIWDHERIAFQAYDLYFRTFELNMPPAIQPLAAQTIVPGQSFSLTANATDPDGTVFSWSLGGSPPTGLSIGAATGVLTWTPTAAQAGQTYDALVQVSDGGNPVRTAAQILPITVTHPDIVLKSAVASGELGLEVRYFIEHGTVAAFDLTFAVSSDGLFDAGDQITSVITVSDPALRTVGEHVLILTIGNGAGQVAMPGAGVADVNADYRILAVADAANVIPEADLDPIAEDNLLSVSGVYHPPAGGVYILGTELRDHIEVMPGSVIVDFNGTVYTYTETDVTGIQARLAGENDRLMIADGVSKPVAAWGGDGDDVMRGGDSDDSLNGGPGSDTILNSGGTDSTDATADDQLVAPTVTPIGITTDTTPVFTWNAVSAAVAYAAQVTFSGAIVAEATDLTNPTWELTEPLPGGVYQIRVRAIDEDGNTTAYGATLTFTVDDPTPATPSLTAPAGSVSSGIVDYQWTTVSGAVFYELRIQRIDQTADPLIITSLDGDSHQSQTPLKSGTYDVSVRAVNSEGDASAWSTARRITVGIAVPTAPELVAIPDPLDDPTPTLRWFVPVNAWTFELQVDRTTTGQVQPLILNIKGISGGKDFDPFAWTPDLALNAGSYVFRVRAVNSDGISGPWSADGTFAVNLPAAPPEVPRIISVPDPNSTGHLDFTWTISSLATMYELQVNQTAPVVRDLVLHVPETSLRTLSLTQALPAGTFSARVRAINNIGASLWSEAVSFNLTTGTTVDLPGNVDGDSDFDANDSFLIHQIKLAGTDAQINQSKGSSPLTAPEIRASVDRLSNAGGDVDGDGDYDANDSFLIHLVKLAGTDAQINQSKGSSPLSASGIRSNIAGLGGAQTAAAAAPAALQPVYAASSRISVTTASGDTSPQVTAPESWSLRQSYRRRASPELFDHSHVQLPPMTVSVLKDDIPSAEGAAVLEDFRTWIDRL